MGHPKAVRSLIAVSLFPWLLLSGLTPQSHAAKGVGSIIGNVLGRQGNPVEGATVYTNAWNRPPGPGLRREGRTDKDGNFVIRGVPAGSYLVCAVKQADGYPDPTSALFAGETPPPKVTVQAGKVISGVVVRVGPRAARLKGQVVEAPTDLPVKDAGLDFTDPADPTRYLMGTTIAPGPGGLNVLVPVGTPFVMQIEAPGYDTCYFTLHGCKSHRVVVTVPAATTYDVVVRMRPSR
jgi:Carboxypeptidase regulatory-like domain